MEKKNHFIKNAKTGRLEGSVSLGGKKGLLPPKGFAVLSSLKTSESIQSEIDYKKSSEKVQRLLWARVIADSNCVIPENLEDYQLLGKDALVLVSSDSDFIQEPGEPIFNDARKDTVSAFLKTKIFKTTSEQDGTKKSYYLIPGFLENNALNFALRQTTNAYKNENIIEAVVLHKNGEEYFSPKSDEVLDLVNNYVRDSSVLNTLTRGFLQLNHFTVHVDDATQEVSLFEVKATTDWFPSDLAGK